MRHAFVIACRTVGLVLLAAAIPASAAAQTGRVTRAVTSQTATADSPTGRPLRFAVFGTAGLFSATAKESFEAVLDTRSGTDVGIGAQVAWQSGRLRGLFVEVDASRFEETGERAFVDQGEVFPLGIPLTIGLTPIEVSVGYRLNPVRRTRGGVVASPIAYFAGGGVGSLGYTETDDEEEISEHFTAYHVMAGADVTLGRLLQIGAEARYRWVPDGLGAGGISDAFNETDLGGSTFRIRIGVGF
jgi:Outer membrane protein beta-barrel domain